MRAVAACVAAIALVASCKSDPCGNAKSDGGQFAWFEDDFSDAVACAQARHVPIVLDEWAPWCHTCLSMSATVFHDPSFAPRAGKFVFAAIDTDRDASAPLVAKFPLAAWPTYYVLAAADQAVLARFVGAASVAQFHQFLDAGERAATGKPAGADWHLLSAERAIAAGDLAGADGELTAAIATAPPTWPRRSDALGTLLHTKAKRGDLDGCLALAEAELDHTGNAASASDFMVIALGCAEARVKAEPAREPERIKALRERAAARWQALVDDQSAPMSVDDRSDALENLRSTLDLLGRHPEALAVAERQRVLLDATAAAAPDARAAMTYNWPRAEVYVYLGRPLDLVPALEKSAADLPHEYDPRARLAWLLFKAGKLDTAAHWADEAIAMEYGPRKAKMQTLRADIAAAAHDLAAERSAREAAVATLESLPAGQTSPEAIAAAKAARDALPRSP